LAKAFVVAAPTSGSGKTMLTLGLLRAMHNQGVRVASAKVGPDHIDPRFHEAASGRPCVNLDPWAMPPELIRGLLSEQARESDVVIIEGVMGLFDGPSGGKGSTADLAAELDLPIAMVVDASRQAQSIAALILGFMKFRPGLRFAGVIANRVGSDRHEAILREALEDADIPVLGMVRRIDHMEWPSRHLGLQQAKENQELEQFIEEAALRVARETFVKALLTIGGDISAESSFCTSLPPLGQKIAVADDIAFSFAYPHILEGWRHQGSEISLFSPLRDEAPTPDCDAVFLPGGYPELHAGQIAGNQTFLKALRGSKSVIYGECGGYMVLGDFLIDAEGQRHAMAGLLPVTTSFSQRKLHLGYRKLTPLAGPWAKPLRAHEFHYSRIVSEGKADALFAAADSAGTDLGTMGLRRGKVMGSYAHIICEAS
jgi:cobyrinic acid a,c-diamide synthase